MENEELNWKEVEEMSKLLDETPVPQPSMEMDSKFYAMLEDASVLSVPGGLTPRQEQHRQRNSRQVWWSIAAGIALFMTGWLGGSLLQSGGLRNPQVTQLSGEVKELRESLVLTMMQQSSPGDRILAVNMVNEMKSVDQKIIESLISTLNFDPNDNVRLVALETLAAYADLPLAREGMVRSISRQSSPMVLLRLAEIMTALQERSAIPAFKEILNEPGLNYNVKSRIDETVRNLS